MIIGNFNFTPDSDENSTPYNIVDNIYYKKI